MANIPGSVTVTGFIAPTDTTDTYAVTDPIYGIDGLRSCLDHTERNNVTTSRRREGMLVYTRNDGLYWKLLAGPWTGTDTDWTQLSLSGSQGYQGLQGVPGPQGSQGYQGAAGFTGDTGPQGSQGYQGITGSGSQGYQGPMGYQGYQGAAGLNGNNTTYVYTQSVASSTWLISHNLGKYPSITVYDDSGVQIFGDYEYIDTNNVQLMFSMAITGTAYLN